MRDEMSKQNQELGDLEELMGLFEFMKIFAAQGERMIVVLEQLADEIRALRIALARDKHTRHELTVSSESLTVAEKYALRQLRRKGE